MSGLPCIGPRTEAGLHCVTFPEQNPELSRGSMSGLRTYPTFDPGSWIWIWIWGRVLEPKLMVIFLLGDEVKREQRSNHPAPS
jgi:hypothetical protein